LTFRDYSFYNFDGSDPRSLPYVSYAGCKCVCMCIINYEPIEKVWYSRWRKLGENSTTKRLLRRKALLRSPKAGRILEYFYYIFRPLPSFRSRAMEIKDALASLLSHWAACLRTWCCGILNDKLDEHDWEENEKLNCDMWFKLERNCDDCSILFFLLPSLNFIKVL